MNEAQIRHLLTGIQVDLTKHTYSGDPRRTRWLNIKCPFAPWRHAGKADNNPSFGITVTEERKSVYKCFSCGSKGRLSQLPSQLGHLRNKDYGKYRKWAELAELQAAISRPVPTWESDIATYDEETRTEIARPVSVNSTGYPRALGHPYLRERGINWQTVLYADLRYDAFQKRILFPCYDGNESFVGFTGRSTRKGNNKTKGNDPKVRDYYSLPKRSIFLRVKGASNRLGKRIIVEGLFDYVHLLQSGYHAASAILGTASTQEKIDLLVKEGDPVYFFMDNDIAGWQSLFGTFGSEGQLETENAWAYQLYREIPVWIVPYKTVFDGTDPGSLSTEEIHTRVSKAWLFTGKAPLARNGSCLWRMG